MSAGAFGSPHVDADTSKLAPKFGAAVEDALAECHADPAGDLDVVVFEAGRSEELQEEYYARGRTVKPPETPVTNAQSALYSWHGFLLAVDVISRAHGWDPPPGWWERVAAIFKNHGCKWGGDWIQKDLPHFQWGLCKPSPSPLARQLLARGGVEAVWKVVGAS